MTVLDEAPAKSWASKQCEMEYVRADGSMLKECTEPVAGRRKLICVHEHLEDVAVCRHHLTVEVEALGCTPCWEHEPTRHRCDLVDA